MLLIFFWICFTGMQELALDALESKMPPELQTNSLQRISEERIIALMQNAQSWENAENVLGRAATFSWIADRTTGKHLLVRLYHFRAKDENGEELPSSLSIISDDAQRISKYEVIWWGRILPPAPREAVAKKIRIGDDLKSVQSTLGAPTRILRRRDGTILRYRYDFICQKPSHPLLLFQK